MRQNGYSHSFSQRASNWTKDETWLRIEQNTSLNIMGDWVEPQVFILEV